MRHRVFVDGQEGTTGLRIHEVLADRDDVELLRIDPERRKDVGERARLLNAAEVAFLCLPDAAAKEAALLVTNPQTCVIDASTAHRTAPGWVYGFPELAPNQRKQLRAGKRISNPGCHATGLIALVRPLVDAGLIPPDFALTATSLTGYSGGGKKMIEQYESAAFPGPLSAPRPYAMALQHKHVPEMTLHSNLDRDLVFQPVVGNFYKGLGVSVPLHLSVLACTGQALHAALERHYGGERFVRVMPFNDPAALEAGYFDIQACNDTNRVDLFVFASQSQALLMARLDNLGKGASGAAVQTMNLHLGLPEDLGLRA